MTTSAHSSFHYNILMMPGYSCNHRTHTILLYSHLLFIIRGHTKATAFLTSCAPTVPWAGAQPAGIYFSHVLVWDARVSWHPTLPGKRQCHLLHHIVHLHSSWVSALNYRIQSPARHTIRWRRPLLYKRLLLVRPSE